MNYYSRLSIKLKIIILAVFVSSVVSILAIFTFYNYDKGEIKNREIRDVETISSLVSNYSSVYVEFNRPLDVRKIVKSFDSLSHISQVKVFRFDRKEGRHLSYPYAQFLKGNVEINEFLPFNQPKDTIIITDNALAIYKTIRSELDTAEEIGTVILVNSLDFYESQQRRVWVLTLTIIFVSIVLSVLLVIALQGYISKPVLELSDQVYSISKAKNYGIEHDKIKTKDEIQQLSAAFSNMLKKIENDNEQLIIAKEAALDSVKAKDNFLAKMSHEIRTPLNAIMGLTNLLGQTKLDENQKFYIDSIKTSSHNLLVIINEILDFSKIQAGKLSIENTDFNVLNLIENFKNSLKIETEEKLLNLNCQIPKELPVWLNGDPVRLNQILLNLGSNAVKFTESGEISIGVELLEKAEGNVKLRFQISDTGIGIESNKLEDIFGSFNQASNSTTRKYGGTGLGLTISKELVEIQGGKIWAASQYGVGSSFFFELEFGLVEGRPVEKDDQLDLDTIKEKLMQSKLRILLVEDNKLNRILANRILKTLNIEVFEAEDGRDAIKQLRQEEVDLILMDLHMPDMDGYITTEYIRNNFEAPLSNVPIIALTAAATKGEVDRCFEAGMNEFVSKPVNTEILIEKIYNVLLLSQ